MSIQFDDTLIAIFSVALPKHDDWMAGLNQLGPDSFKLTYRFRYADPLEPGADPFENIDRKSWWSGTLSDTTREKALATVRGVAQELAAVAHSHVHALVREPGESTEQLMERLSRMPFANVRVVKSGTPEWDKLEKTFPELKDKTP
jgi:hypothetical protein